MMITPESGVSDTVAQDAIVTAHPVRMFTHPSKWVNDLYEEMPQAYDRIAGIEIEDRRFWVDQRRVSVENRFSRLDLEEKRITLAPQVATMIGKYFVNFYSDPMRWPDMLHAYDTLERWGNCHRFAFSIVTRRLVSCEESYAMARNIVLANNQIKTLGSRPGSLAVIGRSPETLDDGPFTAGHSMFSLGTNENILQVISLNGNFALGSAADQLEYYSKEGPEEYDPRLYGHPSFVTSRVTNLGPKALASHDN